MRNCGQINPKLENHQSLSDLQPRGGLDQVEIILVGRQVQVQRQNSLLVAAAANRSLIEYLRRLAAGDSAAVADGGGAVAPHVPTEGLADGEVEAADGALVGLGLRRRAGRLDVEVVAGHQPEGLLMAGSVASQSLERRELPVTCLAGENPAGRQRCGLADPRQQHEAVGHGQRLHLMISVFSASLPHYP